MTIAKQNIRFQNETYIHFEQNGFDVEVYFTFDGETFHIVKDGFEVYQARVNKGEGMKRATEKVASLSPVQLSLVQPQTNGEVELLVRAQTQLIGWITLFCDEKDGARWMASAEKGFTEILENDSITFENGVLRFVSRDSGKLRFVTSAGCHETCDCGNGISYHAGMFQLLTRMYPQTEQRRLAA